MTTLTSIIDQVSDELSDFTDPIVSGRGIEGPEGSQVVITIDRAKLEYDPLRGEFNVLPIAQDYVATIRVSLDFTATYEADNDEEAERFADQVAEHIWMNVHTPTALSIDGRDVEVDNDDHDRETLDVYPE